MGWNCCKNMIIKNGAISFGMDRSSFLIFISSCSGEQAPLEMQLNPPPPPHPPWKNRAGEGWRVTFPEKVGKEQLLTCGYGSQWMDLESVMYLFALYSKYPLLFVSSMPGSQLVGHSRCWPVFFSTIWDLPKDLGILEAPSLWEGPPNVAVCDWVSYVVRNSGKAI